LVDCHYETIKLELQNFLWPKTPLLLSNVEESSVTSKAHNQDEDIEGEESEEDGHDQNIEEGGGDQDDHEPIANVAVWLPHAGKVWRGGQNVCTR
jgi:ABC-type Zn2+ transport system substrate-binding protein/surface adhesin